MCRTPPSTAKRRARCRRSRKEHPLHRIAALASRRPRSASPETVDTLVLLAGVGAQGDRHADPLSPRQVLLADASTYRRLGLPAHALRENLLVDGDVARLASGTVLHVGASALLRLMFACEACGQLDLRQAGLAGRVGNERGVLAQVIRGGVVGQGDAVTDLGVLLPAWPDDWRARIHLVLDAMPPGFVIENARLAHLAGIQSTYCRAFPRVLAKLGFQYAAKVVAAKSPSTLPRWSGAGLFDLLPAQLARLPSA